MYFLPNDFSAAVDGLIHLLLYINGWKAQEKAAKKVVRFSNFFLYKW